VKTNSAFKEGTDPEEKKTIIEGDVLCQERFHRHVEIHQAVGIDEEFGEKVYVTAHMELLNYTINEKETHVECSQYICLFDHW
jgi:hypothetical protein